MLAVVLCVVYGAAFTWPFIYLGLIAGNAQAANGMSFLAFPLIFVSSAYVPVESMPGWMQPFAEHQPLTLMIDSVRALSIGDEAAAVMPHSAGWYAVRALVVVGGDRRGVRPARHPSLRPALNRCHAASMTAPSSCTGFEPPAARNPYKNRGFDAVVVGAGFSGLYALYRLRRLGLSARCFEAAGDVGGTWWWNRYPGARCDIESMDYSYSFDPELEQEWDWTERYATQPEILRYAGHVADRHDLRRDIRFDTRVTEAAWDEATACWTVRTDDHDGETVTARFLILAVGVLSTPKAPEIPGVETFAGPTYHTARWPHDGVDFTGRRVGVIGTGSSAIQAIPLIAEQAAHLTVFQRTANYSQPALNAPLDPAFVAARRAEYPAYRERLRRSHVGTSWPLPAALITQTDPDERVASMWRGWRSGRLGGVVADYVDVLIDPAANEVAAEFQRQRIRELVDDPVVADDLCPRTYPYATKRPCLDTGYFTTFNRPHVTLVNLRRTPMTRITPRGVDTTAGSVELDDLVLATGFDAQTGPLLAFPIVGRDGRTLAAEWADGPRCHLGLAVAGFPNAFIITGPLSPSVLSNMMVSIEQHVDWVTDCMAAVLAAGRSTIEADAEAQAAWVTHAAEVASFTLYPAADSWYTGANVAGKPRMFMTYVGGVGTYREICDGIAADGYRGFTIR